VRCCGEVVMIYREVNLDSEHYRALEDNESVSVEHIPLGL
jgi:hypothetical protein